MGIKFHRRFVVIPTDFRIGSAPFRSQPRRFSLSKNLRSLLSFCYENS
ncbi:hypothetical protein LEP1GSC188_1380 [Leptospira weilii serovar Topaz str. LT2116]|uniref:Uncharacterized protein n=1 Tax=Leptospira weilii serovar Topaz str. LT2116 TaxID=1088540 RepID=M3FTN1_9LEPT|nr:hypothetical protein LEP1GSC188_1380 [Leptospira weilii serovar Topaz str. LT2116]